MLEKAEKALRFIPFKRKKTGNSLQLKHTAMDTEAATPRFGRHLYSGREGSMEV
jgi:hypothetical protein